MCFYSYLLNCKILSRSFASVGGHLCSSLSCHLCGNKILNK